MSDTQYLSPNQKALRRLLKNKSAVFGMVVIIIALFLAIFAYLLAPDSTPNANEQIPEIATRRPGFSAQILLENRSITVEKTNWWQKMWFGEENLYKAAPIVDYQLDGNTLWLNRYTGDQMPPLRDSLSLAHLLYQLPDSLPISLSGGSVHFRKGEQTMTVPLSAMSQQFKTERLETRHYYLGTDKHGRDILSRLLLGIRVSLSVGLMAVFIALLVGITIGMLAGYFGGWIDDLLLWFMSVFWSVPLLLLVFAIVFVFGSDKREFWHLYVAVGLTMWVEVARMVRGQVMSWREKEFVEAARSFGFSQFRIMFRHILPNIMGPIMVVAAADFASAIIIEAGLSYLGIGIRPPQPSWGNMLNEYYSYLGTGKEYLALLPGGAIMLLVLAFNLLGNGLRDALDVKLRT
ncbi:MAG: ABC transporter permease [Chitinophagales bacterium]|nr:ABC transporter permease [Chitinophagales bacterium]